MPLYALETFDLDRNCDPVYGLVAFTSFAEPAQGDIHFASTSPLRHTTEVGFTELQCDLRTLDPSSVVYGVNGFDQLKLGGTFSFCFTSLSTVAVGDLGWVIVRVNMYLASTSWASASFIRVWIEVDDGHDIYGAPLTMQIPLLDTEGYDLDEHAGSLGLTEGTWNMLQMNVTCNSTMTVHLGMQSLSASQYVLFDEVLLMTAAADGVDFCDSNPCRNGATCTNPVGMFRYVCICPPDYEGYDCEYQITPECASNPCKHGGTCVDAGVQQYHCICPVLFDLPSLPLDGNCELAQDLIAFSSFSHAPAGSVVYESSSVGMELGFEAVGCQTQFIDETGEVIATTNGQVTSSSRFKIADPEGLCRLQFDEVTDTGSLLALTLRLQIFVAAADWAPDDRVKVWVEVSPPAVLEACVGTDDAVACSAADISGNETSSSAQCLAAGDCTYTASYADVEESCAGTDDATACGNADISGDETTSRGFCGAAGNCTYTAGLAEACEPTVAGINDAECASADLAGNERCIGTDDSAACGSADISGDPSASSANCASAGDCAYTASVSEDCTAIAADPACASADITGDEATSRSNCENAGGGGVCNYRAEVTEACAGTDDATACAGASMSGGNARSICEGSGDCTYYPPQTRQEACEAAGACTYVAGSAETCVGTDDAAACSAADIGGDESTSEANCLNAGTCKYTRGVGVVDESCVGTNDAVSCAAADITGEESQSRNNCVDSGDCTYTARVTEVVMVDATGVDIERGDIAEGQWNSLELNLTGYSTLSVQLGLESGSPYNYVYYDELSLTASAEPVDYCESAPCQNGGSCASPQDCTCTVPEDELLACPALVRCRQPAEFECRCVQGYEGGNCEEQVLDECASKPCLNSGVCVDGVQSYTCECPVMYGLESFAVDSNCNTAQTIVAYTSFNEPSIGSTSYRSVHGGEMGFTSSGCQFTSPDSGTTEDGSLKISAPEQFCQVRFDRIQLADTCTGVPTDTSAPACEDVFVAGDDSTCQSGCTYTAAIESTIQVQVKIYVPSMDWSNADYIQVWIEVEDGHTTEMVNT